MIQEETKNIPYGYFQDFVVAVQNGPLVAVIYTLYLARPPIDLEATYSPSPSTLLVKQKGIILGFWYPDRCTQRNKEL